MDIVIMISCNALMFYIGWVWRKFYDYNKSQKENSKMYHYACENCGNHLSAAKENDYFCPICGEMMEEMTDA